MTSGDLAGSYNYGLVALSALIAVLASTTALDLGGRVTAARGTARRYWLAGGAMAMGIGIWSMHFTAMLAFSLPVPVLYDWPTVLLSLLLAVLASALALFVVSRGKMRPLRSLGASLFMGGGIAGLHYTAMAAMRLKAMCHYSPPLVALSIALAVAFSLISLELTFFFRDERPGRRLRRAASAVLMGAAISAMHYTAMAAATFTPSAEVLDVAHAVSISSLAGASIGIVTLMILVIALVTGLADRLRKQTVFLSIFENCAVGIALTDPKGFFVATNRAFQRLVGYTDDELRALSYPDITYEEDCPANSVLSRELWDGKLPHFTLEKRYRRKDGKLIWVRNTVSLGPASQLVPRLGVAIVEDITERKQAEAQLQRSEAYLAAGQRLSHTGSWALNVSSGELFWSQETFRIFGFDPAHTSASVADTFLSRIHTEDRPKIEQGIKQAPMKRSDYTVDYRIILPDGSIKYIHDVVYPVVNEAGQVVERYGVVMDVTERRRAEEKLQHSFEQLRALGARLQRVREEERTRVAREIHDQLGQDLTAIKLDLAALIREPLADWKQASLRIERLLKLVDGTIQSVRRIATELRPGILDDLGLAAAVEWAAEEFQARTGTKCHVSLPHSDIAMDAERATALFRIFQETLTNVARHANATEVDVTLGRSNGDLFLEVHDNGKGISEEKLSEGQSLGILGMRERALLLGGELIISSAPGEGTTVKVRIPAAQHK